MTKHLVIGSNSFSGQDFVDLLLDDPDNEVIGVSRSPENPDFLLRYKQRKELQAFKFRQFDLNSDMSPFLDFIDFERPQIITNFAAQSEVGPSWDYPGHWFQTNCVALAEMIKHLSGKDYLEKYLHISSPEVYGNCKGIVTESSALNPSTPYAASKAAADMLLKSFSNHVNYPLVTVRSTNVFGARQQLFKIMVKTVISIRLGKKIPLHGGGKAIKSFIHIRDISRGELAVLLYGRIGEIYHLAPIKGVKVRDVVSTIAEAMGKDLDSVSEDVGERLGQDAVYEIDSTKARHELRWKPSVSLNQGVDEVVDWVEKNWRQIKALQHEYIHRL